MIAMADAATISELPLVAGHLALDFTNTASWPPGGVRNDRLVDYAALLLWSIRAGLIAPAQGEAIRARSFAQPDEAARVLHRARELRDAVHDVFAARAAGAPVPRQSLDRLNQQLAEALRHARISEQGGAFHWTWEGAPDALEQMLWPLAWSAADLLTSVELARVRVCAGENCGWLFIDASKNRTRRWCSMSDCGNRAKVRRFRARR
jgi:predicted RNA-binding Zn ribbon-like protein